MRHIEGFLDKHTYFNKGHIWSFAMQQKDNGGMCYFWCVLEVGLDRREEELKQKLTTWFEQELSAYLEKGSVFIQKELNRYGSLLGKGKAFYNVPESPVLHLYFQGELYSYGAGKGGYEHFDGLSGIYLTSPLWEVAEIREIVMRIMEEHALTHRCLCLEEFGNCLKTKMLRAMSDEKLEKGYFLLWEETCDF